MCSTRHESGPPLPFTFMHLTYHEPNTELICWEFLNTSFNVKDCVGVTIAESFSNSILYAFYYKIFGTVMFLWSTDKYEISVLEFKS